MLLVQKLKYTLIIWTAHFLFLFSQNDSLRTKDMVEQIFLDEIILNSYHFSDLNSVNYHGLKHKVVKVYPYIDTINQLLNNTDSALHRIRKKRLIRRYTRRKQKKIISHFQNSIANLTRQEGVILSKLIYREFNMTAYDLIRTYRGGVQAFFWQRLSKLYDGDLKSSFRPNQNKQDFIINQIINQEIEN